MKRVAYSYVLLLAIACVAPVCLAQTQEAIEGIGDQFSWRTNRQEVLTEGGHTQQNIAKHGDRPRRFGKIICRHRALQRASLASLRDSRAHQDYFAENYVGI